MYQFTLLMMLFVVQQSLCPYFSLGFLLSLLDYCVICSSPVEWIRNLDQDPML